jgi:cytidylate kinase
MAVITFSREFGSAGDQVADSVAESLGYPVVDKNLIEKVLLQYGMVQFDAVYGSEHGIWQKFDKEINRIVVMLNKTIQAFARLENIIIVGRGAFAVLRGYPNVLNVSIREPFDKRTSRIMQQKNLKEPDAIELIRGQDQVRKSFLQTFYNIKEEHTEFFDLVIDTDTIPTEFAARWIVEAANQIDQKEISHEVSTRSISVDHILQKTVSDTLKSFLRAAR